MMNKDDEKLEGFDQVCWKWGWGQEARGGEVEVAPPLRKNYIVIVHISLNLRRMKNKNSKFVILMQ